MTTARALLLLPLAACTLQDAPDAPVKLHVALASNAGITGGFDLLATNLRDDTGYEYIVDARGVHLPDAAYHRAVVQNVACGVQVPDDYLVSFDSLPSLRAAGNGDGARFVVRDLIVDGQPAELELERVHMYNPLFVYDENDERNPAPYGTAIAILADSLAGEVEACGTVTPPPGM